MFMTIGTFIINKMELVVIQNMVENYFSGIKFFFFLLSATPFVVVCKGK
jgi:hypothetical protein